MLFFQHLRKELNKKDDEFREKHRSYMIRPRKLNAIDCKEIYELREKCLEDWKKNKESGEWCI